MKVDDKFTHVSRYGTHPSQGNDSNTTSQIWWYPTKSSFANISALAVQNHRERGQFISFHKVENFRCNFRSFFIFAFLDIGVVQKPSSCKCQSYTINREKNARSKFCTDCCKRIFLRCSVMVKVDALRNNALNFPHYDATLFFRS